MMRLITAAVASLLFVGAAAAGEAPEGLVEKGALTYGVAASFAPFEFKKGDALAGFDIDLIEAIAAKLSLKTAPQNMEFKGLIPALQGGRIDLINSAMYIKPEREEQVDFIPYLTIGNRVMVLKGNPAGITGRDLSLCGKTVAVTLGAIEEIFAREDDKKCAEAGKPAITIATLPTANDSHLSVSQGRADAAFNSTPGALELMMNVPDTYETVGPEFENTTRIGMAVRKGDAALKAAIEGALKELVADGTYASILKTWQMPESASLF